MGERIGHKKGATLHSGKGGAGGAGGGAGEAGGAGVGTRAAAGGLAGGGENQGEKGEKETKEWDEEKGNVKPNMVEINRQVHRNPCTSTHSSHIFHRIPSKD